MFRIIFSYQPKLGKKILFITTKIPLGSAVRALVTQDLAAPVQSNTNLTTDCKGQQAAQGSKGQERDRHGLGRKLVLRKDDHDPVDQKEQAHERDHGGSHDGEETVPIVKACHIAIDGHVEQTGLLKVPERHFAVRSDQAHDDTRKHENDGETNSNQDLADPCVA